MARNQPDDDRQSSLFPATAVTVRSEPSVKRIQRPVWTENKALLISRYLYYFVMVTKHGTYLDAFAGPQESDQPGMWAARLVLESKPPWLRRFYLFDKGRAQVRHLQALKEAQPRVPGRVIAVTSGDCNRTIPALLRRGVIRPREATFCLLDQRTFECHWATVQALAAYKATGPKIELFYFLANGWFDRALSSLGAQGRREVDLWWGRRDWRQLQGLRSWDRAAVVCRRFRDELGYASAKPWAIYDKPAGGRIMYFMIHATDHPKAPDLMRRAYERAVQPKEPFSQLALAFDVPTADEAVA